MIETAIEHVGPTPRIVVEHAGSGEFVIFLHGIGGNRRNWHGQFDAFAAHFHVGAWDARGYGDSDDYEGPLIFSDYGDDLARVLDYFGASRAHVVGLSMGGRIAMDFAARYPDRLLTLTLCDTHKGFSGFSDEKKKAFIASRRDPLVNGKEPKDIAEPVARTLVGPKASDAAFRALVDSMCRLHKDSYIKSVEASTMMDVHNDLGAIRVPTHVVVGSDDQLTTVEMAEEIAADIAGAELTVIADAGHLSNIEKPAEFNAATLTFLRCNIGR